MELLASLKADLHRMASALPAVLAVYSTSPTCSSTRPCSPCRGPSCPLFLWASSCMQCISSQHCWFLPTTQAHVADFLGFSFCPTWASYMTVGLTLPASCPRICLHGQPCNPDVQPDCFAYSHSVTASCWDVKCSQSLHNVLYRTSKAAQSRISFWQAHTEPTTSSSIALKALVMAAVMAASSV